MRLVKVIYGYDLLSDSIRTMEVWENEDGSRQERIRNEYTNLDWADRLYELRSMEPMPAIRTAMQEAGL